MSPITTRVVWYGTGSVIGLLTAIALVSLRRRWRQSGASRRKVRLTGVAAALIAIVSGACLAPLLSALREWNDLTHAQHMRRYDTEVQIEFLTHPRLFVRGQAAWCLGERRPVEDRVLAALGAMASHDPDENARALAAGILSEMGPRAIASAKAMARGILQISTPTDRAIGLHRLKKVAPDAIDLYVDLMREGPADLRSRIVRDLLFAAGDGGYGLSREELFTFLSREIQPTDPSELRAELDRWRREHAPDER